MTMAASTPKHSCERPAALADELAALMVGNGREELVFAGDLAASAFQALRTC